MNFSLDKQVALELAEKMGINVSFNNEESGVFFKEKEENKTIKYSFNDFFPELETGDDVFITKDKDVFSEEIILKNQIKIELKIVQSANDFSSSKILCMAS